MIKKILGYSMMVSGLPAVPFMIFAFGCIYPAPGNKLADGLLLMLSVLLLIPAAPFIALFVGGYRLAEPKW